MVISDLSPTSAPSFLPSTKPGTPTLIPSFSPTAPTSSPSFTFSTSFNFMSIIQQRFIVPAGYYFVTIYAYGAQGGACLSCRLSSANGGGFGGMVAATVAVTPGQVLYVYVGGMGMGAPSGLSDAGGYNGGGSGDPNPGNEIK
jgi:hypothetical protein